MEKSPSFKVINPKIFRGEEGKMKNYEKLNIRAEQNINRWYIHFLLALSSFVMLLFSFPTYNINILGFIALVPILFIVYTTDLKKTIIYSIVSGFLFYAFYLFWMNAYLAVVGVSFVTVVFGGYFVISMILIYLVSSRFPKYRVITTPIIWISIEYIRSFGFLGFTFGSMGYTQHNFTRFIQIAEFGGEPLVSFIVVLTNSAIAHIFARAVEERHFNLKLKVFSPLIISIILILISTLYGNYAVKRPIPKSPSLKIALIQALSSPRTKWKEEKWKTLKRLTDLSLEAYLKDKSIDLIVWTETAIRTSLRPNLIYGTPYHMRIVRLINQLKTYFLIGSPDNYSVLKNKEVNPSHLSSVYPVKSEEEIWTNSAYLLNPKGEIIGKYDKMKLTPFGEHFPLGKKIKFLQKILDKFTDSAGFTPGNRYKIFNLKGMKFGVVICWEGTYGYFIREFVKRGADFIINISNDMWTKTAAGHYQHFSITKFRAIENRIWYARAGNDGVTAFINPDGIVVKSLPIKKTGYLIGVVGPKMYTTVYTRYGDVLPKATSILTIILILFSIINPALLKHRSKKGRSKR